MDETPSPFQQQQEQSDDSFDPFQFDFFQTSTTPPIQFLSETSTILHIDIDTDNSTTNFTSTLSTSTNSTNITELISTTEQTTSTYNSTYSYVSNNTTLFNNEIITSSTVNNTLLSTTNYSTENISFPFDEQINETTENILNDNSTIGTFLKNNSDLLINLLNRTHFYKKKFS